MASIIAFTIFVGVWLAFLGLVLGRFFARQYDDEDWGIASAWLYAEENDITLEQALEIFYPEEKS